MIKHTLTYKKMTALLLCLFVSAGTMLTGCVSDRVVKEAPDLLEPIAMNLDTEKVVRGDLVSREVFTGSLVPKSTSLCFELDGRIESMPAYSGKWVEEGEVLLTLDSTTIEEQIESIKKQIEHLQTEADYDAQISDLTLQLLNVELTEIGNTYGIGSSQYNQKLLDIEEEELQERHREETTELQEKELKADLKRYKKQLKNTEIKAPHEGYLYLPAALTTGTFVREGREVAYVINANDITLKADTYVGKSDLKYMNVYAHINGSDFELEYIEPTQDELYAMLFSGGKVTSSFKVVAPEDKVAELECGMYAAFIKEKMHIYDVLMLPTTAIKKDMNGSYVYVMDGENREQRYITIGRNNGVMTEIKEGLQEGDEVYVQE